MSGAKFSQWTAIEVLDVLSTVTFQLIGKAEKMINKATDIYMNEYYSRNVNPDIIIEPL